MNGQGPDNIKNFSFEFDDYGFLFKLETESNRKENIRFSTNGTRFSNLIGEKEDCHQLYLADAYFEDDNKLVMTGRWVETCFTDTYVLTFVDNKVNITADNNSAWKFPVKEPIEAIKI